MWSNPTEKQVEFEFSASKFLNNHNHCLISSSFLLIRLTRQTRLLKNNSINLSLWLLYILLTPLYCLIERSIYIHRFLTLSIWSHLALATIRVQASWRQIARRKHNENNTTTFILNRQSYSRLSSELMFPEAYRFIIP